MKLKGEPKQLVINTRKRGGQKKMYRFNENGVLEIPNRDKDLCKRMARRFEVIDEKKQVKDKQKSETKETDKKIYRCKKCGFTTDNMGKLLAHYKEEHPKNGGKK